MSTKQLLKKTFFAIFLLLFIFRTDLSAEEKPSFAYFTIEKFVLGQGYALEPYKVQIEEGELVSDALMRICNKERIHLNYVENSAYGWYLRGIKGIDSGKNDLPSRILKNYGTVLQDYITNGDMVNTSKDSTDLEEFSYSQYSGWVFFVNDEWQFVGMGSTRLKNNDVVRLKYTIVEGDSGFSMMGSAGMSLPNHSDAIRIVADVREVMKTNANPSFKDIYSNSVAILSDFDVSAMEIDRLTTLLSRIPSLLEENDMDQIASVAEDIILLKDDVLSNDAAQRIQMITENISLSNGYLVKRSRILYDKLSNQAKANIKNEEYDKLTAAESDLKILEIEEEKRQEAQRKEEQRQQDNKQKANAICTRINNIGTVTLAKESLIQTIRKDYNALTSEIKNLVPAATYSKLTTAEATLASLKQKDQQNKKMQGDANMVITKINNIGTVTQAKESLIQDARKSYNALQAEAKKLISATIYAKLTSAEITLSNLKKADQIKKNTPAAVYLKSVKKAGKGKVKLTWKKIAKATGYEIYMSSKKSSGFKKIATIKKAKITSHTKSKLKMKKTYYFRIRAYKKVNGKAYYGKYSKVKKLLLK